MLIRIWWKWMKSMLESNKPVLWGDILGSEKSRFSKRRGWKRIFIRYQTYSKESHDRYLQERTEIFSRSMKKEREKKNHRGIRFGTAESSSLYMKTSEQEWGRGASSSRGKYHTPNTEHSQSEATDGERKLCKSSVTVGAVEINQPGILGAAASGEWLNTRAENTFSLLNAVISYFRCKKGEIYAISFQNLTSRCHRYFFRRMDQNKPDACTSCVWREPF